MSVVLIDWWSPPRHLEFNRNFYSMTKEVTNLYVYNADLRGLGDKCIIKNNYISRVRLALSVYGVCWKNRHNTILFMSYDDIFLPIVQLFVKTIFCYEHNTTPEKVWGNKHAAWQRFTFFNIKRLCQSKSQCRILTQMGQKPIWLGLPVSAPVDHKTIDNIPTFIFVSEQMSLHEAKKLIPVLYGKVIAKTDTKLFDNLKSDRFSVELTDKISIPRHFLSAQALVIALESSVRGTGWYNEAICYGIPLIITSKGQQEVFETTYPGYPYIKGDEVVSVESLKEKIFVLKEFDNKSYIKNYMIKLELRLESALSGKGD